MSPHDSGKDRADTMGHPLEIFRRENAAVLEVVARMRSLVEEFADEDTSSSELEDRLRRWRVALADLRQVEHVAQRPLGSSRRCPYQGG